MLRLGLVLLLFSTALAKETLNVFVISDFSLAFVRPSSIDRSLLASGQFICPSSAYPDALAQFQFTSDVIAGVKPGIPMNIQYYVYSGGDGDAIGNIPISNKDDFTETAIPAYTKFIKLTITPSLKTELLIIFTAAPQSQVDKALPILSNNVKQVIVLGLNGTQVANAYPKSAVTLPNFAEPERVSCIVNELYETIHGKVSDVDAVAICYPPKQPTTILPETTETPGMRILFINDFTSDFIVDDYSRARKPPSNLIKCPGNAHFDAASEFDYTNDIVQGLSDDIQTEIYYYANNGDDHAINPTSMDKNSFETGTEFKDVVCYDDSAQPSDMESLSNTLMNFPQKLDIVVLLSAVSMSTPLSYTGATIIVIGINGASVSSAYPDSSQTIDDFELDSVVVINCMIQAAYDGEKPIAPCGKIVVPPRTPMSVLFVNEFTMDFVGEEAKMVRKDSNAVTYGKCPGGMYDAAGQEFNFTVDVVNGSRSDVQTSLMFSEYLGGSSFYVDYFTMSRDDFASQAPAIFRESCMDDHYQSDLDALSTSLRYVPAEVLVLFTAVPLDQPFDLPNFKRVIVVGLNGARESKAYPDSSISIDDFSRPQVVSCMINRLWDNIKDKSLLSCVN